MRLKDFLRDKVEAILSQWDDFATKLYAEAGLDRASIRDHARGIVDAIAADLARGQSVRQRRDKSRGLGPHAPAVTEAELHGASRFAEGCDVNHAMAEFRALRASVLQLWSEAIELPADDADDITRFNEAIDQALAESLASFTELKKRQSRLFTALLSSSPDLNYIVECNGTVLYANSAFAEVFGKTPAELLGANFASLCNPFVNDIDKRMRQVVASRKTYRDEMNTGPIAAGGRTYEYLLVPVLDDAGRCEAIAGTARDITERKAAEERIRRSANHDSLTDLPNRSLFREQLQHEVKHAARTHLPLGLLFIDLDHFKEVNDLLGHAAGDQLLKEVAARVSSCVRDTDTVARLGGDEFTVILTDVTDPDHIDQIAADIIGKLRLPFRLDGGEAAISASIGIAVYPGDASNADELVRNADEAMYASKNAGRNRYQFFARAAPPPP